MYLSLFRPSFTVSPLSSYDLQILNTYRRNGLGKFLMVGLERLGRAWGMIKIILTVFKGQEIYLSET
jgi:hypothetical protein